MADDTEGERMRARLDLLSAGEGWEHDGNGGARWEGPEPIGFGVDARGRMQRVAFVLDNQRAEGPTHDARGSRWKRCEVCRGSGCPRCRWTGTIALHGSRMRFRWDAPISDFVVFPEGDFAPCEECGEPTRSGHALDAFRTSNRPGWREAERFHVRCLWGWLARAHIRDGEWGRFIPDEDRRRGMVAGWRSRDLNRHDRRRIVRMRAALTVAIERAIEGGDVEAARDAWQRLRGLE